MPTMFFCRWFDHSRLRAHCAGTVFKAALALVVFAHAAMAIAQEPAAGRLMDQAPFDVLTLDKANESKVFKIYAVRLPGRRVPDNPRRTEKIRIKLLDDE